MAAGARGRAWRRRIGIALWLGACVPLHLLWRAAGFASPWPRRFLAGAAWIAGARVRSIGRMPPGRALILANHISWFDIFVLGGATGARFVAKAEVAGWPGVGWLAGLNRTLYVARSERHRVQAQAEAIRAALDDPQPLALFPEGGTGDGVTLRPFRASLLAAALPPPPPGLLLQPIAIDYGAEAPLVAWGDALSFGADFDRLLGLPGTRRVTLHLLPPLDPASLGDRKAIAAAARDAIAAALGEAPPRPV